jgi:hypothetical protein
MLVITDDGNSDSIVDDVEPLLAAFAALTV